MQYVLSVPPPSTSISKSPAGRGLSALPSSWISARWYVVSPLRVADAPPWCGASSAEAVAAPLWSRPRSGRTSGRWRRRGGPSARRPWTENEPNTNFPSGRDPLAREHTMRHMGGGTRRTTQVPREYPGILERRPPTVPGMPAINHSNQNRYREPPVCAVCCKDAGKWLLRSLRSRHVGTGSRCCLRGVPVDGHGRVLHGGVPRVLGVACGASRPVASGASLPLPGGPGSGAGRWCGGRRPYRASGRARPPGRRCRRTSHAAPPWRLPPAPSAARAPRGAHRRTRKRRRWRRGAATR